MEVPSGPNDLEKPDSVAFCSCDVNPFYIHLLSFIQHDYFDFEYKAAIQHPK